MRIAIYSDVHANLPAIQAFMRHSAQQGVNFYQFLGDAVNYGGKPQDCLDEIIKLGLIGHVQGITTETDAKSIDRGLITEYFSKPLYGKILLGNNDAACCGLESPDYFSDLARDSSLITCDLLSDWHKKFLSSLPMEVPMNIRNESVPEGANEWVLSIRHNHSAPGDISLGNWQYIKPNINNEYLEYYFNYFPERICFVGHSHTPCAFVQLNGSIVPVNFPMPTVNYTKGIVNVGSVGQPRYGANSASYIILDSVKKSIELEYFRFDVHTAINDIRNAGFPEQNAERLIHGRVMNKYVSKSKKLTS